MIIINKGKLVGEGAPGELRGGRGGVRLVGRGDEARFREVLEPFDASVELKSDGDLVRARLQVEGGDVDGEEATEVVFRAIAEAGLVLRELRPMKTSLEDVFASLTTDESGEEE